MSLARRLGSIELVSVDSMQVYRGMDIGTAKPTADGAGRGPAPPARPARSRRGVLGRLVPDRGVTRGPRRHRRAGASDAVLVGGTGPLPPSRGRRRSSSRAAGPRSRRELEAEPDTRRALPTTRASSTLSPRTRMEPTNRRRVVRALEVTLGQRPTVLVVRSRPRRLSADPTSTQVGLRCRDRARRAASPAGSTSSSTPGSSTRCAALDARPGGLVAHRGAGARLPRAPRAPERRPAPSTVRRRRDRPHPPVRGTPGPLVPPRSPHHLVRVRQPTSSTPIAWDGRGPLSGGQSTTASPNRVGRSSGSRYGGPPTSAHRRPCRAGRGGDGMRLTKHHGLGNDFLVALHGRQPDGLDPDRRRRAPLCDRRRGIGADGLSAGLPARTRVGDLRMVLLNADGSRAEISRQRHPLPRPGGAAGRRPRRRACCGSRPTPVSARSTPPHRGPAHAAGPRRHGRGHRAARPSPRPVRRMGRRGTSRASSIGNPHLVFHVDDLDGARPRRRRRRHRSDVPGWDERPLPGRRGADTIRLSHWERGAGVTEACGSGASVAAVAAHRWGLVGDHVIVHMPGGDATVDVGDRVRLIGPADLRGRGDRPVTARRSDRSDRPDDPIRDPGRARRGRGRGHPPRRVRRVRRRVAGLHRPALPRAHRARRRASGRRPTRRPTRASTSWPAWSTPPGPTRSAGSCSAATPPTRPPSSARARRTRSATSPSPPTPTPSCSTTSSARPSSATSRSCWGGPPSTAPR